MGRNGSALAIALLLVVALAGCGTKEAELVIEDPVAEALAYAPADAAALAVVSTRESAALVALGRRFPGSELAVGQLQALLGDRVGLDYDEDLRPLLGNPAVVWAPEPDPRRFFAAWVVPDADALGEVLARRVERGGLVEEPTAGEFAVFSLRGQAASGAFARRGPILVFGPDAAAVRGVLARRAAGKGQFSKGLLRERGLGLPEGAVARIVLDARAILRTGGGASAGATGGRGATRDNGATGGGGATGGNGATGGSGATGGNGATGGAGATGRNVLGIEVASVFAVPWASAIERAAVTVVPEADGLRLRARLSTDAGVLAPDDVPIAAGAAAPATRGSGPVVVAVRDPQHTLRVARRTLDRLDPTRLDGLRQAEDVLGTYARVSVQEDLLDRLTGTATITTRDLETFTLRSDLDDPNRVSEALGRLGNLARFGGPLANLAGVDLGGFDVDESGGKYTIRQDGRMLVALQVIDGGLVASTDPRADLAVAGRAPAPAAALPAEGASRARLSAAFFQQQLVARLGLPSLVRGLLNPLGAPLLTARGEREGLDAQLFLPVTP